MLNNRPIGVDCDHDMEDVLTPQSLFRYRLESMKDDLNDTTHSMNC